VLLFAFYAGVHLFGMLPTSMAILLILMRLYGFRNRFLSILIALIFPCLLYIFFEKLAQVPIPRGLFFENWP